MYTSRPLLLFAACLPALFTAALSYPLIGCNVTNNKIPLPAGQTTLTIPSGVNPEYIAIGFGTQNYTCGPAGEYISIGAVATLFDASCIFDAIQPVCNKVASSAPEETLLSMRAALGHNPLVLGRHYFVPNPISGATGISPTFDFRADSQQGIPEAYVIAKKIGDIPSPVEPTANVDWLELQAIEGQGSLAKYAFRILTMGGQPPSLCASGSAPIAVPYAANYWLFN